MNLNENREPFIEIVNEISLIKGVNPLMIEKDYYVSMLLKEIFFRDSNFVFKGGTNAEFFIMPNS